MFHTENRTLIECSTFKGFQEQSSHVTLILLEVFEVFEVFGHVSCNPTLRAAQRRSEPHARPRLFHQSRAARLVRTEPRSESSAPRPPSRSRGARIRLARALMNTHGENAPLLKTTHRHSHAALTSVRNGVAAIIVAGCVVAALAVAGQMPHASAPVQRIATVSRPQTSTITICVC